jgi:16S rRNA (cytidine1402-2'-O)-methyltransferase
VSTPIGNKKDITLRALEVLSNVDYVLAEDTRKTNNLLQSYPQLKEKKFKLIPFYQDIETKSSQKAIKLLKEGNDLALVSNAGTPLICDPGYELVKVAHKLDINIVPVPGASALLSSLVVSGYPVNRFIFLGFLPKSMKKKDQLFKSIEQIGMNKLNKLTVVFYESPNRIKQTLSSMQKVYGNISIFIGREITKKFEDLRKDKLVEIRNNLKYKGEFVIVYHV